jgi:hypothetical protein
MPSVSDSDVADRPLVWFKLVSSPGVWGAGIHGVTLSESGAAIAHGQLAIQPPST